MLCGLYVRGVFGYWPRVYRDSRDEPLIVAAVLLSLLAASSYPAMVTIAVLLPIIRAGFRARPIFDHWVLSSFMGAMVLWLLCATDPYGFLEWAFD